MTTAGLGLGARAAGALTTSTVTPSALPAPASSGIDHIVVLMMENRSFDHFLGWLPGADGVQAGRRYQDRYGVLHATHHLTSYGSCGLADPDHSYEGSRIELNGGKCDGWLKAGEIDALAIGYYTKPDLSFLGQAAPAWTVCDRYFSAVMAETYPNRFYQHAAQTDRLHNSATISTLPTIWDRLKAAGRTGKYYYGDVPFLALWGAKYLGIAAPYTQFLIDAAAGKLADVSFVDPRFLVESDGTSGDDHPHADIRVGQRFMSEVYNALIKSPQWSRTMLVINYDEWGGFYDHVAPTTAPDVSSTTALRGFRVPAIVMSPRARRGAVAHNIYDHTSILRAIEWRWGLAPLTPRDAKANNIMEVLDFTKPANPSAAPINVPVTVPLSCTLQSAAGPESQEWTNIKQVATKNGWAVR